MKAFFIIAVLSCIFISGCSVCRYRQISKTEIYKGNKIEYYRINPKCPTNSAVEGYNKEGYLFYVSVFDSLGQTNYYFYRDSIPVKKYSLIKPGDRFSYKLCYDSNFDFKLSELEYHFFDRLRTLSDSLGLKKLDYLTAATGFKLKAKRDLKIRKWVRYD